MKRTVLILGLLCLHLSVRADSIWIGTSGAGIAYPNIKISRIEGGKIFYESDGKTINKDLATVRRMQVDSEASLNAAEEAYATGKMDEAADGYQKTLRSTSKPWLKDWSANRLVDAANKSGRTDAAISAYLYLLQRDPASAKSLKPEIAGAKSGYLDSAATEINAVLAKGSLTDEQKLAMLGLLIDIHRSRNDSAGEQKASTQVDEILARNPNDPAAATAMVRRKLQVISKLFADKDYAKLISEVEASSGIFVEPAQQADALFLVAQARLALASTTKKPDDLKDAGLAFMRVVANFKDVVGKPHVAESLYQTGTIYEQLGEKETASAVYQQVIDQYLDEPAATAAREALVKLKAK